MKESLLLSPDGSCVWAVRFGGSRLFASKSVLVSPDLEGSSVRVPTLAWRKGLVSLITHVPWEIEWVDSILTATRHRNTVRQQPILHVVYVRRCSASCCMPLGMIKLLLQVYSTLGCQRQDMLCE